MTPAAVCSLFVLHVSAVLVLLSFGGWLAYSATVQQTVGPRAVGVVRAEREQITPTDEFVGRVQAVGRVTLVVRDLLHRRPRLTFGLRDPPDGQFFPTGRLCAKPTSNESQPPDLTTNFPSRPSSKTILRSSILRMICGSRSAHGPPGGWSQNTSTLCTRGQAGFRC